MKRDWDLIREILLAVQARPDLRPQPIKLEGYDDMVVARHVEMLHAAGLLEGRRKTRSSSDEPPFILVTDLTWEGHDFLGALQDKTVWAKLKQQFGAAELAGIPLTVIKSLAVDLLKQTLLSRLGLSNGS